MIDYMVLIRECTLELSDAVRSAIKQGWVPLGGVALHGQGFRPSYFAQAMTRDDPA